MSPCVSPCLVWCWAGWRPRSVLVTCAGNVTQVLQHSGVTALLDETTDLPGATVCDTTEPAQPPFPGQDDSRKHPDFHWVLLTRKEGQSPESGFGCG